MSSSRNIVSHIAPWVLLTLLTIAVFVAAQTEKRVPIHDGAVYSCEFDDQWMTSTGECIDPDSVWDAAQDRKSE